VQPLFIVLLLLLGLQRILEVALSRKHERGLLEQGGVEHAPGQMRVMTMMHAAWFAAMPLEIVLLQRPAIPSLAAMAGLGLLAGQTLRYAAIWSLGERWTVRVVTLPGKPLVSRGIYRYVRHPNYLGVMLEIAALPLMHGAYVTAGAFSVANLLLLRWRIRTEEAALGEELSANTLTGTRLH
jgi:methyltransferase